MYNVTAKSHIGPVGYTIALGIDESNVTKFLAKGILYEAQRIAASKAVKALGGGKRGNLTYQEAYLPVVKALEEVFGGSAEITCNEHVKGSTVEKKFAAARKMLANKKGREQVVADFIGYTGDLFDAEDFHSDFLVAVEDFQNGKTIPNA